MIAITQIASSWTHFRCAASPCRAPLLAH